MIYHGPLVTCSETVRDRQGGRPYIYSRPKGPLSAFELLLPALIARGFSSPALQCLFGLKEAALEKMVGTEGQVVTGTRALRVSKAANGWTLHQMQLLLVFWTTNMFATCIADHVGRSAASVRCKAKALGLPVRERSQLTRAEPGMLHGLLPPEQKAWSTPDEKQFGEEHLRGIRTAAPAIRLRRGSAQCENSIGRLNLPRRDELRGKLINEYNPADLYLEPFRHEGWHFRKCAGSENMTWTKKDGSRLSNPFKKTKAFRDMQASGMADCY